MQNAHLNVTCIQKKKTIIIINHKHDLPNFFFFSFELQNGRQISQGILNTFHMLSTRVYKKT